MKAKVLLFGIFLLCCFSLTAQTTHFIDWELSVGSNATITIDVGDTVEWTNVESGMPHNVISSDINAPAGFGSGLLNFGDSYSFTFNAPVVFDYGCGYHPGSMDGTITVVAPASCDPPTNPILDNVTDTTAEISWTASADETGGYNWAVMADGEHPTTDTPVQSGSTATGITDALATGLDDDTDYDFYVQTDCGANGESTWAGPLSFTTDATGGTFPSPYCGPIELEFGIEPITYVEVAGIANSSGATIGGIDHEDFTGITGTMEQGESYNIALEGNTDGNWENFFTVFIDWNQNGQLDDVGEMYQIGSITNSNGTDGQQATGVISVPVGATLGQTRMRVFKVYEVPNGFVTDPCSMTQNFGQAEDYTILVIPVGATVCDAPTNLSLDDVTETTADVSWTASATETNGYNWVVMNMGDDPDTGTPITSGNTATGVTTAQATGLMANSMYQAYVKTDCDPDGESDWEGPLHILTEEEEVCDAPTNLTLDVVTTTTAEISWTASPTETEGYNWAVFNSGDNPETDTPVTEGSVTTGVTIIVATGLEADTAYDFYIISLCDNDLESNLAGPLSFITQILSLDSNRLIGFDLYPNPNSGIVHLEAQNTIKSATIHNVLGQEVFYQEINKNAAEINISALKPGTYFLKVIDANNKTGVFKIVKE